MTKLLIVDDNEQDLYMLQVLLESNYYEVVTAANGAEALEKARRGPPDMIISDILMPVMDGFSLCREWKEDERLKEIPFVFYTATYTDPKDEELALNLGAERFIVKPVEPDVFVGMLRDVIEEHKAGRLVAPREPVEEEEPYLREYNEALIRKMEDKMLELEQANQTLERHAQELEQRVAERTAELQEVNAELESFTYSVSHDLRAPLRAIQGFANALLEDYGDTLDAVGQRFAQHLVNAAQELDTLIKDLLEYSRLTTAEMQLKPVSLEWVVDEVLTQLKAEIQEKEAQVTVEKPLPEVTAHRTILVQMVANLVTNAIKFVDKGVQPQVRLWTEARDEWVRLWVEDNGIGIPPEQQERIFHVFERLHGIETYPGTGIGLSIVRKGMERMGGKVGVESEVGKGSRFWVELLRV